MRLLSGFFLQLLLLGLLDHWGICEFIAPLKVSYAFIWLRKFSLHCVHSQSHHLPHWTLVTKINLCLAYLEKKRSVSFLIQSTNHQLSISEEVKTLHLLLKPILKRIEWDQIRNLASIAWTAEAGRKLNGKRGKLWALISRICSYLSGINKYLEWILLMF